MKILVKGSTVPPSEIDRVLHREIGKLNLNGNSLERYEAFEKPDTASCTDQYFVIALVKSGSGNYSVRGAYFGKPAGGRFMPQSNFSIIKRVGQDRRLAELEYDQIADELAARFNQISYL